MTQPEMDVFVILAEPRPSRSRRSLAPPAGDQLGGAAADALRDDAKHQRHDDPDLRGTASIARGGERRAHCQPEPEELQERTMMLTAHCVEIYARQPSSPSSPRSSAPGSASVGNGGSSAIRRPRR